MSIDDAHAAAPELGALRDAAAAIRGAFNRARALNAARQVLGGLLILPAPDGARTIAVVTGTRLHLARLEEAGDSAMQVLARHRSWLAREPLGQALTREMCDALCVGARQAAQDPRRCRLIASEQVARMAADDLLPVAFALPTNA